MTEKEVLEQIVWPAYRVIRSGEPEFPPPGWQCWKLMGPGGKIDSVRLVQFAVDVQKRLSTTLGAEVTLDFARGSTLSTMGEFVAFVTKSAATGCASAGSPS